jgi:hypothetical protein
MRSGSTGTVRKYEAAAVVEGWKKKTSVMSVTVRITQPVIPQRSSYQTEKSVISRPNRLPWPNRR